MKSATRDCTVCERNTIDSFRGNHLKQRISRADLILRSFLRSARTRSQPVVDPGDDPYLSTTDPGTTKEISRLSEKVYRGARVCIMHAERGRRVDRLSGQRLIYLSRLSSPLREPIFLGVDILTHDCWTIYLRIFISMAQPIFHLTRLFDNAVRILFEKIRFAFTYISAAVAHYYSMSREKEISEQTTNSARQKLKRRPPVRRKELTIHRRSKLLLFSSSPSFVQDARTCVRARA